MDTNVVVFVRHQEKKWDNKHKGRYRYDAPLSEKGMRLWKGQILELEEKYGVPNRIVTSPFFRCMQMVEQLMNVYRDTPIEVDSDCGEYLGHQKLMFVNNYMFRDETLIYPIIYKEDISQLKERAKRVYEKYSKYSGYTLIITHGFLMHNISYLIPSVDNSKAKHKFDEGETLVLSSHKDVSISDSISSLSISSLSISPEISPPSINSNE